VRDPTHATELIDIGAERVVTDDQLEPAEFDVVLDGVGGAWLHRAIQAVRPEGTIVLFGATDPEPAKLTLLDFIGHEGARILTYFSYASGDEASIGADLATLAKLVSRGGLRPTVGAVIDWHQADQALIALGAGQIAGKAVITIDRDGTDA
jgi:NADPH:quinone reductase-like Zn-dependent oxidoreductase